MKKRTKTNIVDDLIEKNCYFSSHHRISILQSSIWEGARYSAFFNVATAKSLVLTLMFKTPISPTPAGWPQVLPEQQHRLHAPACEGPQTTTMAAKVRSRGLESCNHRRKVTLMGKSNKEIFVRQAWAQHKRLKSFTGWECKHRMSQDPRGLAHEWYRKMPCIYSQVSAFMYVPNLVLKTQPALPCACVPVPVDLECEEAALNSVAIISNPSSDEPPLKLRNGSNRPLCLFIKTIRLIDYVSSFSYDPLIVFFLNDFCYSESSIWYYKFCFYILYITNEECSQSTLCPLRALPTEGTGEAFC